MAWAATEPQLIFQDLSGIMTKNFKLLGRQLLEIKFSNANISSFHRKYTYQIVSGAKGSQMENTSVVFALTSRPQNIYPD